ncbi:MAG: hypothetical protein AB1714_14825 [Acidobacteriota bacterium]
MNTENPIVVSLTLQDQQRVRERMHRLRNILGTVSAFSELIAFENISEKGRARSRKVVTSVMEARELLDEIHAIIVPRKAPQ